MIIKFFKTLVNKFKNKTSMTEYEMQCYLEKLGYSLYNPKIDNDTDMEKLYILAVNEGFTFNSNNYAWHR